MILASKLFFSREVLVLSWHYRDTAATREQVEEQGSMYNSHGSMCLLRQQSLPAGADFEEAFAAAFGDDILSACPTNAPGLNPSLYKFIG